MKPTRHLDFLLEMRALAREARSRQRRCHYPEHLRQEALSFLTAVWRAGGSLEDAAEMMSVHRQTLEGWLDRATQPSSVKVKVSVHLC